LGCPAQGRYGDRVGAFVHEGTLPDRSNVMMSATFAGMGFGSSDVHIPHANAYPIAGWARSTVTR
jgi:alcohol dehydrogenase class IV